MIERAEIAIKINDLITPSITFLNVKKLQGYKDLYRLKVNDFRIVYKIDKFGKLCIVGAIGPRKDIYFSLKRITF